MVEAVHAAVVFAQHLLEILDVLHFLNHLVVQSREDYPHLVVSQALHELRQFLQRLVVDHLGVAETQQQGDVLGAHILLQQRADLLDVPEVVEVAGGT